MLDKLTRFNRSIRGLRWFLFVFAALGVLFMASVMRADWHEFSNRDRDALGIFMAIAVWLWLASVAPLIAEYGWRHWGQRLQAVQAHQWRAIWMIASLVLLAVIAAGIWRIAL